MTLRAIVAICALATIITTLVWSGAMAYTKWRDQMDLAARDDEIRARAGRP